MTDIAITEVTTKAVNGTGAFDTLMFSVDLHLHKEHSAGRITGNEYAQVYLSALQATMQQSIVFVLERQNASATADKTVAETDRVSEEILLLSAQKDKVLAEVPLVNANVGLVTAQTAQTTAETAKIAKEEDLIDGQILQIAQEVLKSTEEVLLITAQTGKVNAEIILLGSQNDKIDQEILRIVEEVIKVRNEGGLILQKTYTEEAQISDTAGGGSVTGVVGKQKDLYTAQTDGFTRDAEQKMAKIMADVANVRETTGNATTPPTALDNPDISKVIAKAAAGIGVVIS